MILITIISFKSHNFYLTLCNNEYIKLVGKTRIVETTFFFDHYNNIMINFSTILIGSLPTKTIVIVINSLPLDIFKTLV